MGIKGLDLRAEPPCIKVCWVSPWAGMLFVPGQKLSVIEWTHTLSSDTLRYGFSLLKSKYWSFVYLQLCFWDRGPGDFIIQYQGHYQWFREWIHLRTENKGNRKKEAYSFVLFFFSVSFNLFLYVFFSHQVKIAQTSHFRYKRPTDTMIQHTPEK